MNNTEETGTVNTRIESADGKPQGGCPFCCPKEPTVEERVSRLETSVSANGMRTASMADDTAHHGRQVKFLREEVLCCLLAIGCLLFVVSAHNEEFKLMGKRLRSLEKLAEGSWKFHA